MRMEPDEVTDLTTLSVFSFPARTWPSWYGMTNGHAPSAWWTSLSVSAPKESPFNPKWKQRRRAASLERKYIYACGLKKINQTRAWRGGLTCLPWTTRTRKNNDSMQTQPHTYFPKHTHVHPWYDSQDTHDQTFAISPSSNGESKRASAFSTPGCSS